MKAAIISQRRSTDISTVPTYTVTFERDEEW